MQVANSTYQARQVILRSLCSHVIQVCVVCTWALPVLAIAGENTEVDFVWCLQVTLLTLLG